MQGGRRDEQVWACPLAPVPERKAKGMGLRAPGLTRKTFQFKPGLDLWVSPFPLRLSFFSCNGRVRMMP